MVRLVTMMSPRRGLTLLAVLAIVAPMACRSSERPGATEIRRLLAEGRGAEIPTERLAELETWPSAEAQILKGRIDVACGRLSEAAQDLRTAMAMGGDRDQIALLRALIASRAGRHPEAIPALWTAYSAPGRAEHQVVEALARSCLETYDLTRARTVLERWVREFPDDFRAHLWLAEVHERDGSSTAVIEADFREALSRAPAAAPALLGLAENLTKAHRNDEAAEAFEAYLALRPDDVSAHLEAGRNLAEQGDDLAAERHFRRAMELDARNAEVHVELAQVRARHGDWKDALAELDRAVALDPYDVAAHHHRGMALARVGRPDDARGERDLAARLRADLKGLNDARRRLMDAPGDRDSQLAIARWMFAHGHEPEGARWAEKLLADRPRDPEASRLLADYHARRGEEGLANRYRLDATDPIPSQ